ncbi:tetratricopeptide repeat protein [Treponema pectinovorum]|uniref:tetratricopeptide repeat protein n=1 Tax=Treponema pectinovorum TaxID=164 RepID=UPI0011CC197A|nr:tetratricopeptide repeat protein [Treponema pectinovorum]
MDPLTLAIPAVVVIGITAIIVGFSSKKSGGKKKGKQKNRSQIIRDATKKLSQDPHNPESLIALGDLYFNERSWDKAYQIYDTMLTIAPAHTQIDPFTAALRQGICALKLNKIQDAFRGLPTAYQIDPSSFDVNYNLGLALYANKEYDKAIPCLKKALVAKPEASNVNAPLALAMYNAHHFKESLAFLRRALDENPDNKEVLYAMADAMQECGYGDKAMKVFMHLRPDPEYGARSCLSAGIVHMRMNQYDKAMQDFEIGLKHQNTPPEIALELRYRYAQVCSATKNISLGMSLLKEIQAVNPTYKDVPQLLARYSELNQNKNLQIYLMSSSSDFVALCRKVVMVYYTKSIVKIQDISVQSDHVEILLTVDSGKWENTEIFRFYRTTGSIGELYVRDFQSKVSDSKADRGICFTAGIFSEEAKKYSEGRPIDLIQKDGLIKILKKVDIR